MVTPELIKITDTTKGGLLFIVENGGIEYQLTTDKLVWTKSRSMYTMHLRCNNRSKQNKCGGSTTVRIRDHDMVKVAGSGFKLSDDPKIRIPSCYVVEAGQVHTCGGQYKYSSEFLTNKNVFKESFLKNKTLKPARVITDFRSRILLNEGIEHPNDKLPSEKKLRVLTTNWRHRLKMQKSDLVKSVDYPTLPHAFTVIKIRENVFEQWVQFQDCDILLLGLVRWCHRLPERVRFIIEKVSTPMNTMTLSREMLLIFRVLQAGK